MATSKSKATVAQRKQIIVGTICYAPLEGNYYAPVRQVPYIRLRGLWLAKAGFSPHDRVEVVVEAGRIVLNRL